MSRKVPHIKSSTRSVTSVDKFIGLRLRTARLESKLSQQEVGNKLGVSFQQIQKYEKGANRVSSPRLLQFAELFGKPTTYFLKEPNYKPNSAGEKLAEFAATREGHQLLEAAMPLPPLLRQSLIDLARTMNREQESA
jgi:transcriptional regulator with XRE-family HTH domain